MTGWGVGGGGVRREGKSGRWIARISPNFTSSVGQAEKGGLIHGSLSFPVSQGVKHFP